MENKIIPIAFALTPRMQSFIEFRDALRCLTQAMQNDAPYAWLPAAKELHDLLIGEGNKRPATPNVLSLFDAVRKHFHQLSGKHLDFQSKLIKACEDIALNAEKIRQQVPAATDFLTSDAWLRAYSESIRKQDLLGHKLSLPQIIQPLWHEGQRANSLFQLLEPAIQAVEHLNQILHAHVPWEQRIAREGFDQITLHAQDDIGLVIIGLRQDVLAQGIVPSCSGFRSTVRLRFSKWGAGKVEEDLQHDQNYALMAVPIS